MRRRSRGRSALGLGSPKAAGWEGPERRLALTRRVEITRPGKGPRIWSQLPEVSSFVPERGRTTVSRETTDFDRSPGRSDHP